jgi:hypothetical protein
MTERRMTDEERADRSREVVAEALAARRAGDRAKVNSLFAHAVHDGIQPDDMLTDIVEQTGGRL